MQKILIVDDEPDLREIVRLQLEKEDYQILEAGSGQEAELIIEIHKPDVLILDLNLPDIDGADLFRKINKSDYIFECVVISAITDVSRAVEILKEGVFDYFVKPVEGEKLQIVVRNAFEKVRLAKEIKILKYQLKSQPRHHLAAIMFTDMVGYSSLSAENEQKALRLINIQRELLYPILKEYSGTLIKEMGDGNLISFTSSINSVACANKILEVIRDVKGLELRIGIHQGDIMEVSDDVFGDDVNIASKIQQIAKGGEILISDKVQRDISSEPQFNTSKIKDPQLEGIKQPVEVFSVK